jgi:hypothetical protein
VDAGGGGGAHGSNVVVDRDSQRRKTTVVQDGLHVSVTRQRGDNSRERGTKRTALAWLTRRARTHSLRPCIAAQCSAVLLRTQISKVDWGRRNAAGEEGAGGSALPELVLCMHVGLVLAQQQHDVAGTA